MNLRPLNPAIAGERSFVVRSWVESYGTSNMAKSLTFNGLLPRHDREWRPGNAYWRLWNPLVDVLVKRARVTVAEDNGLVAGFMCWEPWDGSAALHYIYTRLSYRGQGVARDLLGILPSGPIVFTHRSRAVRSVPESWRYSLAPLFGVQERKEAA